MHCSVHAAATAFPVWTDRMKQDTAALLVCAGSASRMGGINKILHPLGDSSVLLTVLNRFCRCGSISEIILVCKGSETALFQETVQAARLPLPVRITEGGSTRQESVRNGFSLISQSCEFAAIHDGARPLVRPSDIERVIADARRTGAAALGVPVKDTVKAVQNGIITATPDRASLYLTQTPQVFSCALYRQAAALAEEQGRDYTDDCQLIEALGKQVTMTPGDYANIKLTTPEDFAVAEALLAMQRKDESI